MFSYVSLSIAAFLSIIEKNIGQRVLFSLLMFFLSAALLGLRGVNVGIDTEEYHWIYFLATERPWHHYVKEDLEPLFILTNKVAGYFGLSAYAYIFAVSVFVIGSFAVFFHRYSPNLFISWIVFFGYGTYFQFHNTMRQSFAIAILLFSVRYLLSNRPLIVLILSVIAFFVHYTSVVFLILCLAFYVRPHQYIIFFIWLISLVFAFYPGAIFSTLSGLSAIVPSSYTSYLSDQRIYEFGGQGLGLRLIVMQVFVCMMLYGYVYFKKRIKFDVFYRKAAFFMLSGVLAIILTNFLHHVGLISRLSHYFTIFLPISLAVLPLVFRKSERMAVALIISAIFVVLYVRGLMTDPHGIFPYYFLWW